MTVVQLSLVILRLSSAPEVPGPAEARARILAATIVKAAEKHGVDPLELAAIQHHESNGNPHVIGRHGEVSRWQFLPATARLAGYEVHNLRMLIQDPIAADIAAWYLAHVTAICAAHGHTEPSARLRKYKGLPCHARKPGPYATAILTDIARVTAEPLTVPEAIADHHRRLAAEPRPVTADRTHPKGTP